MHIKETNGEDKSIKTNSTITQLRKNRPNKAWLWKVTRDFLLVQICDSLKSIVQTDATNQDNRVVQSRVNHGCKNIITKCCFGFFTFSRAFFFGRRFFQFSRALLGTSYMFSPLTVDFPRLVAGKCFQF